VVRLFKVCLLSASHVPVLLRLRRKAQSDPQSFHAEGWPQKERLTPGQLLPEQRQTLAFLSSPALGGENNAAHPSLKRCRAVSITTNQPCSTGGDRVAAPGARQAWGRFGSCAATRRTGDMARSRRDGAWVLLVLEQELASNPETSGSYELLTTVGEMDVLASKYLWRILTTPCWFPLGLTSQSNE